MCRGIIVQEYLSFTFHTSFIIKKLMLQQPAVARSLFFHSRIISLTFHECARSWERINMWVEPRSVASSNGHTCVSVFAKK